MRHRDDQVKPRFIEVIKLGVLVAVVGLAVTVVLHGPADAQDALRAFSSEGVSGWFSTTFMLVKWLAYAFILAVFACAACLVLSALGILTWLVQRVAVGMAWLVGTVRSAWVPPPLPLDTEYRRTSSGKVVTVRQVLDSTVAKIQALEQLTKGIEPPPPPKPPEVVIAELQAEVERLRTAEKRKAASAKQAAATPAQEVVK